MFASGRFLMVAVASVVLALGQGTGQGDPFSGSFAGDQLRLELRAAPNGSYTGRIVLGEQTLPAKARPAGANLMEGTFTSQGHDFPFTLSQEQGKWRFVTEGNEYWLTGPARTTAPASNPLAQPGKSPSFGGAGTSAHRHEAGLGFRVPSGWTAQDRLQGTLLLPPGVKFDPNRQDNPEFYAAVMQEGYDPSGEQQLVRELSAEFVQNGVTMVRSGVREPFALGGRAGAIYTWEFQNANRRFL